MIAFVKGIVHSLRIDSVIVDNQGIGYQIYVPSPQALGLGQETMLYTYQHVREDAITLFGFLTQQELELFMRLISVKGVGPKTVLNMLGVCGADAMVAAIETGDVAMLKKLPGIGAKSAQQIVLDLKGKLVEEPAASRTGKIGNSNITDAMDALRALGYKQNELSGVEKELAKEKAKSVDEYVRLALGIMLKRKGV